MIPFDEHMRREDQNRTEVSILHRTALIDIKLWKSKAKKFLFLKPYIEQFRTRLISEYSKKVFMELIGEDSGNSYYKNEAIKYRKIVMNDAKGQDLRI